jgi:outer membrane protein
MKTPASIFTKISLSLLLAGGLAACNQDKSANKAAPVTTSTTTTTPKSDAIVYVNYDSLLTKYNYAIDVEARLKAKGKAAQSDLVNKGQAFQRQVAEYQKSANTMSADQRAPIEQQLQRKQQELQAYQQNAGAQVQNDQAAEQTKLYEKITAFMATYAKEKGYKMILTFQKGNPTILYGDSTLDVSSDVIKRLNDAYAKDKK